MKYDHFDTLICVTSIGIPIIIIQGYLINEHLLVYFLLYAIIAFILFLSLFVHGLMHNIKAKVLSLPLYVISFTLFFLFVRYQDNNSFRQADNLISLIEKYKTDHNSYPVSLTQLEGNYITGSPKTWRGFIPYEYKYSFDRITNSFSLDQKFGKHDGKIWQSSMGSWDYYGD